MFTFERRQFTLQGLALFRRILCSRALISVRDMTTSGPAAPVGDDVAGFSSLSSDSSSDVASSAVKPFSPSPNERSAAASSHVMFPFHYPRRTSAAPRLRRRHRHPQQTAARERATPHGGHATSPECPDFARASRGSAAPGHYDAQDCEPPALGAACRESALPRHPACCLQSHSGGSSSPYDRAYSSDPSAPASSRAFCRWRVSAPSELPQCPQETTWSSPM